ncbi:MAG: hypothetical protein IE926_18390 [Micrococcales bacterium]|nr:hypothetical protein [Micrococcales bacterium]
MRRLVFGLLLVLLGAQLAYFLNHPDLSRLLFRPFPLGMTLLFVALAGVPWRDHLLWAGAEVVHLVAFFAWTAAATDPAHGLPAGWYALALGLRLVAVGRLGWVVWSRATWGVLVRRPPADWDEPAAPGTLGRLPAGRPVDDPRGAVGDTAYPPVTERP